jgi:hypothetical protein
MPEGEDMAYTFVLACLANLPQMIWPIVDRPDYVQQADSLLAQEGSSKAKDRIQARQQERVALAQLGRHVEDVDQWRLESGDPCAGVAVDDGYMFIADNARGLRILDITDPASPIEVGLSPIGGHANSIVRSQRYL